MWLFKQEVSRKHSNLVRGTKDGTGKAIDDSRLKTSARKHLTISEIQTFCTLQMGWFIWNLFLFFFFLMLRGLSPNPK